MKLADYLTINHMTYKEFADVAGLSVPSIWKLACGKAKPTLDTMLMIERATDNKVTGQDFLHQHGSTAMEEIAPPQKPEA